ncbi:hypothetical protein [Chondrinema litorale]|uniref:hypothetical protein n=1 Tax=Chondrinema litorale TaxID=2994555 RepID=UPI002542A49F|nr:hypothetical protein [Chondrinema litorale]UZR93601.1 hypothetical protein OQ292_17260 [Chondrinema litorale]
MKLFFPIALIALFFSISSCEDSTEEIVPNENLLRKNATIDPDSTQNSTTSSSGGLTNSPLPPSKDE